MPHVKVKMWPGRSEEEKTKLANSILNAVKDIIGCSGDYVTVAIEEVPQEKWFDEVYYPEIEGEKKLIYKKPGYNPPE